MTYIDPSQLELEDRVVSINRVTKVVKGGRRLRFAAIRKAVEDAKKNLISVPMVGSTIPHEVIGTYGAGRIMLKPAEEGSGIAAGGAVRAVIELSGVGDVTSKSLGRNTPINVIRATIDGLKQLKTAESVSEMRGISAQELLN